MDQSKLEKNKATRSILGKPHNPCQAQKKHANIKLGKQAGKNAP